MRDGQELSLSCGKCHDRLCDPCQRERQSAVVEGVLLKCHGAALKLRFVTLTLKHQAVPLDQQLDRLTACFKLLRGHADIKSSVTGGVWFIEVKLDAVGRLWHPHLHVIVEGDFISQRLLCQAWHQVTGDSYIAHIKQIDDVTKRARYVTKYATKPLHQGVVCRPEKLDEFAIAIKGKRLYQCFGTWSKAVQRPKLAGRKLERVGHMSCIVSAAAAGDAESLVLLHVLHGRFPGLKRAYPLPAPHVPDLDPFGLNTS